MRIDRGRAWRDRAQNLAFLVLLATVLVLAAWLSQQYRYTADWTAMARNTLTQQSRDVIATLDEPIRIAAFVADDALLRSRIEELVDRYRRAGARIELEFVNPELQPALVRELGVRGTGEMIVRVGEASERLQRISEQSITNALAQLGRDRTRWIVFVTGHGERDPLGDANFDLGEFGRRLRERGYRVQTLNLATQPAIPDNTDLLVLASPRTDYLPGEIARIRQYLDRGRNLLWLTEPHAGNRLAELARALGVRGTAGVVVDAATELRGAATPDFAAASDYPPHPLTQGFDRITLFPQARALSTTPAGGWQHAPLVRTHRQTWTELDPLSGGARIAHDADRGEISGPLTLALAGTRAGESSQRVAIVGDGDWLSNAYIGNGGNLDLGLRLFGWLVADDARMTIAPDRPPDLTVALTRPVVMLIGFGFLLVLPALLAGCGLVIWLRRRRR